MSATNYETTTVKTQPELQAALDAGAAIGEAKIAHLDGDIPYAVIPQGYRLESLDPLLAVPSHRICNPKFNTLESFIRYVKEFKTDGTVIAIPVTGHSASAIFDYHTPKSPAWGRHRATFEPTETEAWKAWKANNKTWLQQQAFATFLEERAVDVVLPSSADFKQMALALEARKEVNFTKGIRLDNGDTTLSFKEVTTAKSGEMEIPSAFTIQIAPILGEPLVNVEAFLRYQLSEGKITFKYELRKLDEMQADLREIIGNQIEKQTGLVPFVGQF